MTKMSPIIADPRPFLRDIPGGESEANLYILLREQLPDNWMVIYNASVYNREQENQIDFLVIVPDYGVMNIECKGRTYTPQGNNGRFYFGDDQNQLRWPLQQAERAIINFANDSAQRGYNIGYYSYMVFFPDASFPQCEFEGPIFTSRDRNNLKNIIINVFEGTKNRVHEQRSFSQEDAEKLFNRYSHIYRSRPYRENYDLTYLHSLMQACLTTQQVNAITRINRLRDARVIGAAGTGKTWIALFVAQEYARQQMKVLYVCYNLTLACELTIKLQNAPLIKVSNYHQLPQLLWNRNLCQFNNGVFDDNATDIAFQQYMAQNPIQNDDKFDLLLIDEAQDFSESKIDFLLSLVKQDDNSKVVLFADRNQFIYRHNQTHWVLDPLRSLNNDNINDDTIELNLNMRNSSNIHQYCANLVNDRTTLPFGLMAPEVINIEKTIEEFRTWLEDDLIDQYAVRASELAVISDERNLLESVLPNQFRLPNTHFSFRGSVNDAKDEIIQKLKEWHRPGGSHPWKGTIHAFKGLEADYIVVITRNAQEIPQLLHYVGASRPQYLLAIVQIKDDGRNAR